MSKLITNITDTIRLKDDKVQLLVDGKWVTHQVLTSDDIDRVIDRVTRAIIELGNIVDDIMEEGDDVKKSP